MEGQRFDREMVSDPQERMPKGRQNTARLPELKDTIAKFVEFYNSRRIHHTLSCDTPEEWYISGIAEAE